MKYNALRPIFYTKEMEQSITFYTEVLGFTVAEKNDEWKWASLYKDGVEVMFADPNEHMAFEKPVFTGSFYISVDDVEACWQQLKDKASIVYPLENFEWGMKEFAIYDNNGYVIQFGQEV